MIEKATVVGPPEPWHTGTVSMPTFSMLGVNKNSFFLLDISRKKKKV